MCELVPFLMKLLINRIFMFVHCTGSIQGYMIIEHISVKKIEHHHGQTI
jgi:hypothetical protein